MLPPLHVAFGDLLRPRGLVQPQAGSSHPSEGIGKPFPGYNQCQNPSIVPHESQRGVEQSRRLGRPGQDPRWPQSHKCPSPTVATPTGVPSTGVWGGQSHPREELPVPRLCWVYSINYPLLYFPQEFGLRNFYLLGFYSLLNKQIPCQGTWEPWGAVGLCGQNFSKLLYWTYKTQFNPSHRIALHEVAGQ